MLNKTYSSLGTAGTVQAVAADAVVANHTLTITGAPVVDVRLVEHFTVTTAVSGVAPSCIITPTNAASTNFSVLVTQVVNGVTQSVVLNVTTVAAGSSATTICNAWRYAFNAVASKFNITASGTSTLVLTGISTLPSEFTVTQLYPEPTSGTITVAYTPGTVPVNTYAVISAQGVTTIPSLLAGQVYTSVAMTYRSTSVAEAAGDVTESRSVHTVYINEDATNYAALAARLAEIASGFGDGVTTADPAFIAIA
jgi:hypothetical protein